MAMTHRERAIAALERRQPDYVPTFELVFHETERDFEGRTFYGGPAEPAKRVTLAEAVRHNAQLYVDIARRFDHSLIMLTATYDDGTPRAAGAHELDKYFQTIIDTMRAVREIAGDEFMIITIADATFSIPNGQEMMDFALRIAQDPDGLKRQAEESLRYVLRKCKEMVDAGMEGFALCGDYAFNNGPFLSPEMFAEFVTPYLKEEIAAMRAMGAYTIKHTDGDIMPIIDQLVDAKPHALHSLDPMAGVDIKVVKERYGDRVALCGNVHCAHLQTGTPEQVRQSAEYCMKWGKPGGGYIFCTSNCVFRGMPLESYDLIQEVWRQGRAY
jgi:uroporphyrinogen decarboxylase